MVNALGVFGWGVGGIEARKRPMAGSALLDADSGGCLVSVCNGRLSEGATATDLVLTVTENAAQERRLSENSWSFYGSGLSTLSVPRTAPQLPTWAPEYGATMGFFPVDAETLAYLQFTARSAETDRSRRSLLQRSKCSFEQIRRPLRSSTTRWSWIWETVEATVAGPKRPQDRVALRQAKASFHEKLWKERRQRRLPSENNGDSFDLSSGPRWVIAAITSCTNTSNPSLMLGGGPACEESCRARFARQALGQDQPGAWFEKS